MIPFCIGALELFDQMHPRICRLHDIIEIDVVELDSPGGREYNCATGKAIEIRPSGQ